jgi:DNA polymerase
MVDDARGDASPNGGRPLDARRLAYLEAMGIPVWLPKSQQLSGSLVEKAKSPAQEAGTASGQANGSAELERLAVAVAGCTRCSLHRDRTQTVFGVGNPAADWLLVGEAPGAEEDRRGEPFVGQAGQLLNAMLAAMDLARDDIYIANVLKCRPPRNRDPMGEEVRQCEPYLLQQIDVIQPKIIVAMGRFAAQSLLKTNEPIGKLRGRVHSYFHGNIPLVVTYHPAYLLRSPIEKRKSWQDLVLAKHTFAA